jgi:hypothetical protein
VTPYASAGAFRRALEDRLTRHARAADQSLVRLRKGVVFQRLLARLIAVAPDRWILKGGLALDFRLAGRPGARPRVTKDMDLARAGAPEDADADVRRAQALDLGDYFELDVRRVALPDEDPLAGGAWLRYRVRALLAGRVFEEVVVDVGFAPPGVEPDLIDAPNLLAFAGLAAVRVPALPAAVRVAEKVHAYNAPLRTCWRVQLAPEGPRGPRPARGARALHRWRAPRRARGDVRYSGYPPASSRIASTAGGVGAALSPTVRAGRHRARSPRQLRASASVPRPVLRGDARGAERWDEAIERWS